MKNPKVKAYMSVETFDDGAGKKHTNCTISGEMFDRLAMLMMLVNSLLQAGTPQFLIESAVHTAFENKGQFDGMIDEKITMNIPDNIGSTKEEES